jgi:RES domain-containing protein
MPTVYRVVKSRYRERVFDGTGAYLWGGRWNSPGRPVVYAATCLQGNLLEILVHAGRVALPGPHHAARARLPDDLALERLTPEEVPGWEQPDSAVARAAGDRWLEEARTAVLHVPAASARPHGTNVLLNPLHPHFGRIRFDPAVPVEWDDRLFRL